MNDIDNNIDSRPSADTRKYFHDTLNYMRSIGMEWEFIWEYKRCRRQTYTIVEAVTSGHYEWTK